MSCAEGAHEGIHSVPSVPSEYKRGSLALSFHTSGTGRIELCFFCL